MRIVELFAHAMRVQGDLVQYVWLFLAGALLCNCIPHLAAGLQVLSFPTPFSRPRGVGPSMPLVNVLWGFANLTAGLSLATHYAMGPPDTDAAVALVGGLVMGIYLALHFGKVQRNRRSGETARPGERDATLSGSKPERL